MGIPVGSAVFPGTIDRGRESEGYFDPLFTFYGRHLDTT
jgi:hypothetical protein